MVPDRLVFRCYCVQRGWIALAGSDVAAIRLVNTGRIVQVFERKDKVGACPSAVTHGIWGLIRCPIEMQFSALPVLISFRLVVFRTRRTPRA
jgi:hypothetical protein